MFKISSKVDKMYVIRGERRVFGKKVYKHIQFNHWSGNPIIQTDIAYRAHNVVAFTNKDEARVFMKNFFQTRIEQLIGDTAWKIAEYKPAYKPACNDDYILTFKKVNTIYGSCYTIEDIKYIKNIY